MLKIISCDKCKAGINVKTYRKFVVCPYCENRIPFDGFEYDKLDPTSSKFTGVKYVMDCPACRCREMARMSSKWLCPSCGYSISRFSKRFGVFWFCDECDAYLKIQKGFTTKDKIWKCSECGHENGVTKKDIM